MDIKNQLYDIEQSLYQHAYQLGQLNMLQNKVSFMEIQYLESISQLKQQINEINTRISKKKDRVAQEQRDKTLLHERLNASIKKKNQQSFELKKIATNNIEKRKQIISDNKNELNAAFFKESKKSQPQKFSYQPPQLKDYEDQEDDQNAEQMINNLKAKLQKQGEDFLQQDD